MKLTIERKFEVDLEELIERLDIDEFGKLICKIYFEDDLDELVDLLKDELKARSSYKIC